MIKNFIVFSLSGILCLLLISCPMTDISSESGSSSSAKVVSKWVGTSYSTVTGDFTLFIYDDDSFSGSCIFPGGNSIFKGIMTTLTEISFYGTGSGKTTLSSDGSFDAYAVIFSGGINNTSMSGSMAIDYSSWDDENGTFTATKQ